MRTEEELRHPAEQNNRRVKQAAAAAVALILLRRDQILAAATGLTLVAVANRLEVAIEQAIREGRSRGRQAGAERINAEAVSAGIVLAAILSPTARMVRDATRARLYAARFARAWLTAAQGDDPVSAANRATFGRLETIGLTEGAAAFNEARRDYIRLHPHLMRMWDAVNDKRTCSVCRDADGTVVGASEPFPLGEPGSVHPRCQCTWHLLTVEEARR